MKKSIKIFLSIIITIMIVFAGLFFYAFRIEPFNLNVNDVDISQNKASSVKLVQFSDTHIKPDFTHEKFQKVVDMINQQNADIVVFTGGQKQEKRYCEDLRSCFGRRFVPGIHDNSICRRSG